MHGDATDNAARTTEKPCGHHERARRARFGDLVLVSLVLAVVSSGLAPTASSAACQPGWTLLEEHDNSFSWGDAFTGVEWEGTVQLWEELAADCQVLNARITFTGPSNGGTLNMVGSPVGVYYSVQFPQPYETHPDHSANPDAYGEAVSWNPDGYFQVYYAHVHWDVNSRGADEYFIGTNTFLPVVVSEIRASFLLPLDLLGETVYAQLHVYPNLCLCEATPIVIRGANPPPPPPPPPPPADTWSVYIHAHDDDWQLFQSPESYSSYLAGNNVLFIIVSAGDAGYPMAYWQAREQAHRESIRYLTGNQTDVGETLTFCHSAPAACHRVWQRTDGRTVSVFMRLPDGNVDGTGWTSTGFVSLARFRDGLVPSLTAVDGSTTYASWRDLVLTVAAIVDAYAPRDSTTEVNAPDFDRYRQTFQDGGCLLPCIDHSDHLAVADLVYAASAGEGAPWARRWFIGYPIGWADSRYPRNLDTAAYAIKKDLFMVYNDRFRTLTGIDLYAEQPAFWENCFQREYYRTA